VVVPAAAYDRCDPGFNQDPARCDAIFPHDLDPRRDLFQAVVRHLIPGKETESTLGRERELLIFACKKCHVAKRLLEAIKSQTQIPAIAYLFS
jgi:hypothetical protein